MKIFNVFTAFSLIVLSLTTTSCHQQDEKPLNREIVFAIGQAPLNLDPRYATDATSERINRLIYQSLVDFDAQSKPNPSLATWVTISPTEYRFTLKKNCAPFHHVTNSVQTLLTANDVKATYDSFTIIKDSPHAAEFDNINNIIVTDDRTVTFHLKQPDRHFPAKLIIGILPAKLIAMNHDFSHAPVGNGPLKLVAWRNQLNLVRVS
ncbi:MAG: ABC transporter substrate-binding protein, partial [Methylotenera sp.]|nr:ABC transporter substrate-binding protein [Methylotenera sp.]